MGFPVGSAVKNPPANAGDEGLIPGSGRSPWRRAWQPTPVFLPGESHGQRSLVGYGSWGCKESDKTERLNNYKMCVWLNNIFQSKCKSVIILKRNLMKPSNGIPWRGQVAYFWRAHRPHQGWVTYLFLAKSSHLLCNHLLCLELHLACLTPSSENLSWKAFFPFYRCRSWDSRKLNGFTCSAGKWRQAFSFCALLLLSTLECISGGASLLLSRKTRKRKLWY